MYFSFIEPAKKVDTPKVGPYVPTFYNKEELQLLFSIIKDTNIKIPIKTNKVT